MIDRRSRSMPIIMYHWSMNMIYDLWPWSWTTIYHHEPWISHDSRSFFDPWSMNMIDDLPWSWSMIYDHDPGSDPLSTIILWSMIQGHYSQSRVNGFHQDTPHGAILQQKHHEEDHRDAGLHRHVLDQTYLDHMHNSWTHCVICVVLWIDQLYDSWYISMCITVWMHALVAHWICLPSCVTDAYTVWHDIIRLTTNATYVKESLSCAATCFKCNQTGIPTNYSSQCLAVGWNLSSWVKAQ